MARELEVTQKNEKGPVWAPLSFWRKERLSPAASMLAATAEVLRFQHALRREPLPPARQRDPRGVRELLLIPNTVMPTPSTSAPHVLAVGARERGRLACEYFQGEFSGDNVVCQEQDKPRVIR